MANRRRAAPSEVHAIVVIPVCDEERIVPLECLDPEANNHSFEILLVVNHAVGAARSVVESNARWFDSNHFIRQPYLYLLDARNLPPKQAGVGTARKIGMDEACRRFRSAGRTDGIILSMDADTACPPNTIDRVVDFYARHPKCEAAISYFEHPLHPQEWPWEHLPPDVFRGIYAYELYLRYHIRGMRWAGHVQGYQTIGSCMSVRYPAYLKRGGMNRRQAGEDFYFLHKYSLVGTLGEIQTLTLHPSPRISHRVPFGTGKAIADFIQRGYLYAVVPEAYAIVRHWLALVPRYFEGRPTLEVDARLEAFLHQQHFNSALEKMRAHSATPLNFMKRFFQWFDALKFLQWLHYYRDHNGQELPVETTAAQLLKQMHIHPSSDLLQQYRTLDRMEVYRPWDRWKRALDS